ncbi:MAG: ABC transporter ATP-binding protein [Planctomycetales bacterium]|nr:ABC transporter ATP-binding protein [Planctomycetales bacterium]
MTTLSVQNVSKSFPTAGQPLEVLRDVSLQLSGGQSMAIVGPSGSGKSTLLQILGTLDRPDDGTVMVDGDDPFVLDDTELARWRNQKIGFIFQDHHLLPQLSVIENVLVPALATGKTSQQQIGRATELLDSVGLADRVTHLPSQLSGGERERVAIARALLMRPALVLADEPTGNLDEETGERVLKLLLDLTRRQNKTLIMATHSPEVVPFADRVFRVHDGQLLTTAEAQPQIHSVPKPFIVPN